MSLPAPQSWSDHLRGTLECYEETLLRRVASRLIKPRNQWPVDELILRCTATTNEVTVIDRRLKELEPAGRQILALIGHSRQPFWSLGNLVELAIALGQEDGLSPLLALLEAGLLYPQLRDELGRSSNGRPRLLNSFEQWLAFAGGDNLRVFAHPLALSRAVGEDLGLGEGPPVTPVHEAALEADGLDWLLRLGVLWQQVSAAPLRRTQQGEFFKRDSERLTQDPLLNAVLSEGLPSVPDAGFLAVALAEAEGIVRQVEGELKVGELPGTWENGLPAALAALFSALPGLRTWNALDGHCGPERVGNPFPSAYLLALLVLGRLPESGWATPEDVQDWVSGRHPYWASEDLRPSRRQDWAGPFLLGLAYQLRLVQAARTVDPTPSGWAVRLSAVGRWILGLSATPPSDSPFSKTLLVQPNLEILAYRQGLTPTLLGRLTRFAEWQNLGSACTLRLAPESVYRALESGLRFEEIQLTLDKHGTRPTPPAVLDSLRTWSNKRDRISIYPSAALLEFASAEQLNQALARGFPGVRLSERLAVVASESAIDYSLFRLTSSRDYAAPPEQCVAVAADGLTLTVDMTKADLLLDSELTRFAESLPLGPGGVRQYCITPTSMANARAAGMNEASLEAWFQQRVGQLTSPAARLLLNAGQETPPALRAHLVLHLPSEEMAEGLLQWPATRSLIQEPLGPTTLSVRLEDVPLLRERLAEIGVSLPEIEPTQT